MRIERDTYARGGLLHGPAYLHGGCDITLRKPKKSGYRSDPRLIVRAVNSVYLLPSITPVGTSPAVGGCVLEIVLPARLLFPPSQHRSRTTYSD